MSLSEVETFYRLWVARDTWTQTEAACLIAGKDPDEEITEGFDGRQELKSTFFEDEKVAKKNIIDKNLKTIITWHHAFQYEDRNVDPFFYINKAIAAYMPTSEILLNLIKIKFINYIRVDPNVIKEYSMLAHAFLPKNDELIIEDAELYKAVSNISDKDHPNFAFELYVAICIWSELYSDKDNSDIGMAVDEAVIDFLARSQIKNNGQAVIERIATLITPNHKKTINGAKLSLEYKTKI